MSSHCYNKNLPLSGRDWGKMALVLHPEKFLLTRPLRDVTRLYISAILYSSLFLLTRSLRDVTNPNDEELDGCIVSTHTPLAGRDYKTPSNFASDTFLLTRPLRDVTDIPLYPCAFRRFLLTRPLRDVTMYSSA